MLTRRRFLGYSALAPAMLAYPPFLKMGAAQETSGPGGPVRLAILGNTYRSGSHLQSIADRFLVGYPLNGDWHTPNIQIVSMYIEPRPAAPSAMLSRAHRALHESDEDLHPQIAHNIQPAASFAAHEASPNAEEAVGPNADLSMSRSREFGFRLCANIPEALRCGGDRLDVDAVLTILEQGDYPSNDRGQILYPRFDFFEQCRQVFEEEKRAVPYFNHGSLSFSFHQARSMVDAAERLKFPLLAGSCMPLTWRLPDIDLPMGAHVEEAIMVGVGSLEGSGFEALDAMQSMLERRKGDETGIKAVQLLEGDDVWSAGESGCWSKDLLSSALSRSDAPQGLTLVDGRMQDMAHSGVLPQLVDDPAALCIEYRDGTRATLLMLTGADNDFTFAAKLGNGDLVATQFFRSPAPNVTYSACLAAKIEEMFTRHVAPYPVQRTLLTSGILEAGLLSRRRLNVRLETPHLALKYQPPAESQYSRT